MWAIATRMPFALASQLKPFLKIAVSAGLIGLLLSRLDLAQLAEQLARTQPLWLAFALALYLLAILVGVFKWQMLVRIQHLPAAYGDLTAYTFAGLFAGNVLPSNIGGDLVRAYELARAADGPAEPAVMSVVMDRLLGLVAFCGAAMASAIVALIWLTPSVELEMLEFVAAIALAVVVGSSGALLFSPQVARGLRRVFERGWLARIQPHAASLYRAIQVYRGNMSALVVNVVVSASNIAIATLAWYATARALGLDIPLLYFFLFNPLVTLVLLLPISFNGLGPKEATTVYFFGLIGVPSESAFALSLLFHAIVVLTSLPGGVLWWRGRTRASPVLTAREEKGEA